MTLHEFLQWENKQELRFEFDGVHPVAMAGGTAAHAAIQRNLVIALGVRLRGRECQALGSELKIQVAGRIRYPEAFVVCSRVPPRSTVVADPVVVFEVLSDGSAYDDLVRKNGEYRATPSIQRYVILQKTHSGAVVFARKGEDWVTEIVREDGLLSMPEIRIEVPLREIYAGLELTEDPTSDKSTLLGRPLSSGANPPLMIPATQIARMAITYPARREDESSRSNAISHWDIKEPWHGDSKYRVGSGSIPLTILKFQLWWLTNDNSGLIEAGVRLKIWPATRITCWAFSKSAANPVANQSVQ